MAQVVMRSSSQLPGNRGEREQMRGELSVIVPWLAERYPLHDTQAHSKDRWISNIEAFV